MRLVILLPCFVQDDISDEMVRMLPGDTIDIAENHAKAAILRGLAEPYLSRDDAKTGAPPRNKAAMTGAPERR